MNNVSSHHYSLQNPENYKFILENSLNEINDKYIALICEYFRYIIENIKMTNAFHFKFILNLFKTILILYNKHMPNLKCYKS
jgi:hypothetical protein